MAKYRIKKQGDLYYNIFLIEKGKSVLGGMSSIGVFDDLYESDGDPYKKLVYSRDGKNDELNGKKIDYDLMIESVSEIDLTSYKKNFKTSFTVFQIENYEFKHKFDDPGLITSTDYLTVNFINSWPDCKINSTFDIDSLITKIRREITLDNLGI